MNRIFGPILLGALSASVCVTGCKKPAPTPAPAPIGTTPQGIAVVWAPESRTEIEELRTFVENAVGHCVAGNYEEYRLLWSYKHKPTSAKRFRQLWKAVESIEIRVLKEIRFRDKNGKLVAQESPTYVFYAFVELREKAKVESEGKLDDRHMILLIVQENDHWAFVPAGEKVKAAMLNDLENPPLTSQPHDSPKDIDE